jgi:hypothetical protein
LVQAPFRRNNARFAFCVSQSMAKPHHVQVAWSFQAVWPTFAQN